MRSVPFLPKVVTGVAGSNPRMLGRPYATVQPMAPVESDARIGEVLEAAAAFFNQYLRDSETGVSVRARIAREGVDEEIVDAFGVGYAPGDRGRVLEHLAQCGYSAAELHAAGIATWSDRGHVHAQFRSLIMFPVRDRSGRILGFAGMATNPGPSWPLWSTSPDRGRFRRRTAIFAIDRTAAAIAEAGRAVVLNDCLDVLRLHQGGCREAVAVIRSPITPAHRAEIAAALGVAADAARLERRDGAARTVIRRMSGSEHADDDRSAGTEPGSNTRVRASETQLRADPIKTRTPAARAFLQVARGALGIGIPLAWVAIVQPDPEAPGGIGTPFVGAMGGVAATYVMLAIVTAFTAARVRARSRARRMRGPWERGATEWQPIGWTYHMLEDILIGAAIVSVAVCMVLFLTIGGFAG